MSAFSKRVYILLKQVPAGRVTTYKSLGQAINSSAYQAIGQALKRNPDAPNIPCHRVVSSNGSVGGFAGEREGKMIEKKKKLLRSEGIKIKENRIEDFEKVLFDEFEV